MSNIVSVPGTLRGYRAWVAVPAHPGPFKLTPLTNWHNRQAWSDNLTCKAACIRPRVPWEPSHRAPDLDCTCGVHARYRHLDENYSSNLVIGSIQAHGRIVMQRHGFRAEYAKVEALVGMPPFIQAGNWLAPALIQEVAEQHGVGYVDTWKDLAEQYPPTDVRSLLQPELDWVLEKERIDLNRQYLTHLSQLPAGEIIRMLKDIGIEPKDPAP